MEAKITMTIKVGETDITLTVEECKELKETLDEMFPSDFFKGPFPPSSPIITQPLGDPTCQQETDTLGNPISEPLTTGTDIIYSDSQTTNYKENN